MATRGSDASVEGLKFLTVPEAAILLRVHQMTVYRKLKEGKIPACRIGASWRIPSDVVDRMMNK